MILILGAVAGAVCTLAIIGLHRLITYDRYWEGYYDGLSLHDVTILEREKENKDE